jgi:AbrB family looped-hinge helix DNA binding protein
MASTRDELIRYGDTRSIGSKGEVTLPKDWREKHDIEPQDQVGVVETDDGCLEVIAPEQR